MEWTTPSYDEIKMDAEIGSYQEDGEAPPTCHGDRSLASLGRAIDVESCRQE